VSVMSGNRGYATAVGIAERVRDSIATRGGDIFVLGLVLTAALEQLVQGHPASVALASGVAGLPLLARRRWPLAAPCMTLVLTAATLAFAPIAGQDTGIHLVLSATAVWLIAANNAWPRAGLALPILGTWFVVGDTITWSAVSVGVCLAAGVAGSIHRRQRLELDAYEGFVEQIGRERDAELEAAAVAERARIARELHDIVAHSVSVMTIQAGAARLQLTSGSGQAFASIRAVEEATSGALAELDRLVGLLGPADAGGTERVDSGLHDAGTLVARMREAGLDARLSIEGEPRPVPPGLDLALYRVLQEALTNAMRHGGLVPADVRVRYAADEVRVEVASALPAGTRTGAAVGADRIVEGHGLVGMRERVAMYGGSITVGPRDGRFRVDVRVPTP
jgi:signal transduction histidine kinase